MKWYCDEHEAPSPGGGVVRWLAMLAWVLSAGCLGANELGNLRAERTGDTVAEPLEERSPTADVERACGTGPMFTVDGARLSRAPYLQWVRPEQAILLWTGPVESTGAEVVVSRPGSSPPRTVRAEREVTLGAVGQYRAELSGLAPGEIHCYSVRDRRGTWAGPAGFRAAPSAAATEASFIVFGDSGGDTPDQAALADQMARVPYDLLLHTGDVAYGAGKLRELETRFFAYYAPLLRSLPAFPSLGNHDYGTDAAAPYLRVFALPENAPPAQAERWYAFDWGPVHFVALDTTDPSAAQAAWLDADLTANERPWVVVYGHHPGYSSGGHGGDRGVRRRFEPLFVKHRVPLVLNGHDHNYERTRPIRGVTYVVTGGGGVGTRGVGRSEFTAFSEAVIHFVHVAVAGDTLRLRAIDATGQQFDSAILTR